tara:strand:- start:146 stop:901 length:756 start_codon:yes stop_codon:yes gene_type:complete
MATVNKIWIQIGQSWNNGQGGNLHLLQTAYDKRMVNVRIMTDNGFKCINPPDNNNQYPTANQNDGVSIEFYFQDIAEHLGEDVYLVKYAQGSTRLQFDNTRTDWNVASVGELYDGTITAINDAITWMNTRGKQYSFEGVIWYQGEGDCIPLLAANEYQQNNIDLMAGLVTATGNANLKFYQYNIVLPPAGNRQYLSTVNTAKLNFTNLDTANRKLFTPVVTDWNADNIHPSVAGYLDLWNNYQKDLILNDL